MRVWPKLGARSLWRACSCSRRWRRAGTSHTGNSRSSGHTLHACTQRGVHHTRSSLQARSASDSSERRDSSRRRSTPAVTAESAEARRVAPAPVATVADASFVDYRAASSVRPCRAPSTSRNGRTGANSRRGVRGASSSSHRCKRGEELLPTPPRLRLTTQRAIPLTMENGRPSSALRSHRSGASSQCNLEAVSSFAAEPAEKRLRAWKLVLVVVHVRSHGRGDARYCFPCCNRFCPRTPCPQEMHQTAYCCCDVEQASTTSSAKEVSGALQQLA